MKPKLRSKSRTRLSRYSETITVVSDDALPYQAGGYSYTNAPADNLANFYATNYDDSAWSTGPAAFGNNGGCFLTAVTDWPGLDGGSPWLYLRRHFTVPAGTTNLSLGLTVADAAQVFLNGTLLTPTNTAFNGVAVPQNVAQAAYNTFSGFGAQYMVTNGSQTVITSLTNVFFLLPGNCSLTDDVVLAGISTNLWHTNDNVLAVKVYDLESVSYFDNRISIISSSPP